MTELNRLGGIEKKSIELTRLPVQAYSGPGLVWQRFPFGI